MWLPSDKRNTASKTAFKNKIIHNLHHSLCFHRDSLYLTQGKKVWNKYLSVLYTPPFIVHKPSVVNNVPIETVKKSNIRVEVSMIYIGPMWTSWAIPATTCWT